MRREHRRQAGRPVSKARAETPRDGGGLGKKKKKKKTQIKRNEIRARVTKIGVYSRGSECEDNRGPTRLDSPSFGEARDGPPRSAREFRQPSGARDGRSRVRRRVRFSPKASRRPSQTGNPARKPSKIRGSGVARCSAKSIDGELSLRHRCQSRYVCSNGKIQKNSTLPNNRRVTTHPSRFPVLSSTRGQLLQGRPHHPLSPGDSANDGNPFGTASARPVRPSHGTAGRASIIRHTGIAANTRGAQIPQHLGVPLCPRRSGRRVRTRVAKTSLANVTYGECARGQMLRKRDGPRVYRAV